MTTMNFFNNANAEVKVVNCTPHTINVAAANGAVVDIPASGIVPRCSSTVEVVGEVSGITVTRQVMGDVVDVPEPAENTIFVVSRLVASACPERHDFVIPGPMVRDEEGRVVGCNGFSVL